MQTFLPYADFSKSAACLDNKRLNKQIVECKQMLDALSKRSNAYVNHPATLMWKDHVGGLLDYALFMCHEYEHRKGKRHALHEYIKTMWSMAKIDYPTWLGYEPFHAMHRAVLLDKDPEWYGRFGWAEEPAKKVKNGSRMSYPYLWPSKMEQFKNNTDKEN